jgi:hypothetical protein
MGRMTNRFLDSYRLLLNRKLRNEPEATHPGCPRCVPEAAGRRIVFLPATGCRSCQNYETNPRPPIQVAQGVCPRPPGDASFSCRRGAAAQPVPKLRNEPKASNPAVYGISETAEAHYGKLKSPISAYFRDVNALIHLGAVKIHNERQSVRVEVIILEADLDWPGQVSESDFMARVKSFPKAKGHGFLSST